MTVTRPLQVQQQDAAVREVTGALRRSGGSAGLALTFWKASGQLAASFHDDCTAPPPALCPERSPAMVRKDEHWVVDGGLRCASSVGSQRVACRRHGPATSLGISTTRASARGSEAGRYGAAGPLARLTAVATRARSASTSRAREAIPSYPIPSHPIPSQPILSHPIPSHPIPAQRVDEPCPGGHPCRCGWRELRRPSGRVRGAVRL